MWTTLEQFYKSKEWIEFRAILIAKRGRKCKHCNEVIIDDSKITGHHVIELTVTNVNDRSISLNEEVVEIVCHDCHNRIHKRFKYAIKKNERGIYLIYGAPLSGKSSFVLEHKTRHDIVVDMDRLFEAITMLDRYDKPNELATNVLAVRNALIDNIKTRYGKFHNAWVIGGYPCKYKREQIVNMLGATPILIEATKEECINRLLNVNDHRRYMFDSWEKYINEWFEEFEA